MVKEDRMLISVLFCLHKKAVMRLASRVLKNFAKIGF